MGPGMKISTSFKAFFCTKAPVLTTGTMRPLSRRLCASSDLFAFVLGITGDLRSDLWFQFNDDVVTKIKPPGTVPGSKDEAK
jgi:hypothetical protein